MKQVLPPYTYVYVEITSNAISYQSHLNQVFQFLQSFIFGNTHIKEDIMSDAPSNPALATLERVAAFTAQQGGEENAAVAGVLRSWAVERIKDAGEDPNKHLAEPVGIRKQRREQQQLEQEAIAFQARMDYEASLNRIAVAKAQAELDQLNWAHEQQRIRMSQPATPSRASKSAAPATV